MEAGKLRFRVTLQQLVAGSPQQKATGEPDEAWADVASFYADIVPLRGNQLLLAQQINSRVNCEVVMRYRTGVTAAMRIVHGSTIYDIEHVPPVRPRYDRFVLGCSTGLNQG